MTEAWSSEREQLLRTMWEIDGASARQCGQALGVTRNAVIGKVHRLKLRKHGPTPNMPIRVRATKSTGGRGSAGKYRGVAAAAQKARSAKLFKAPPTEVFKPAADDLAVGAWSALPGTVPVSLEALPHDGCKWPIGESAPFLFCGCKAATGSSYCPTHKHRSAGKGTTDEQHAVRKAEWVARGEDKFGFRKHQAGQSL